jgi:hypothetical protein
MGEVVGLVVGLFVAELDAAVASDDSIASYLYRKMETQGKTRATRD